MYAGFVVETATTPELFARPRHPYTVGLLSSISRIDADEPASCDPIEGVPPEQTGRRWAARSRPAAPGGCRGAGPTIRRSSPRRRGEAGARDRHDAGRGDATSSPATTRGRRRRGRAAAGRLRARASSGAPDHPGRTPWPSPPDSTSRPSPRRPQERRRDRPDAASRARRRAPGAPGAPLLEVRDLRVQFALGGGFGVGARPGREGRRRREPGSGAARDAGAGRRIRLGQDHHGPGHRAPAGPHVRLDPLRRHGDRDAQGRAAAPDAASASR